MIVNKVLYFEVLVLVRTVRAFDLFSARWLLLLVVLCSHSVISRCCKSHHNNPLQEKSNGFGSQATARHTTKASDSDTDTTNTNSNSNSTPTPKMASTEPELRQAPDSAAPGEEPPVVVEADADLLERGICRVELPPGLDPERWAAELSRPTPLNFGFEGDGEAFLYRNIMDEPGFPFDLVLLGSGGDGDSLSEIGRAVLEHFPVLPNGSGDGGIRDPRKVLSEELRLDDAFCVHYHEDQHDTRGKKHRDPSDITVNLCLHKSENAEGSLVMFHGARTLRNAGNSDSDSNSDSGRALAGGDRHRRFLVPQKQGHATLHFGDHPHETTALTRGSRTNVILTYVYTDPSRSDATTRTCY